jgi:hypothetical protein
VQGLQGKTERVTPTQTLECLLGIYADKAALRSRHEAAARAVGQYDVNNTYQYVIAREDQHLRWLADAVRSLGGSVPDAAPAGEPSDRPAAARDEQGQRRIAGEDGRALEAFVERWRPRVAGLTHARHRLMLELMLGETLEQARLFRQAEAGRLDLLGRRTGGERLPGLVLPTRWVE